MSKILYDTTLKNYAIRKRRHPDHPWQIYNTFGLFCHPPKSVRLFASESAAWTEINKLQPDIHRVGAEPFEVTLMWTE